jgi:4-diphosphocytidyl-2-C-methyl-D-erythritol kinase
LTTLHENAWAKLNISLDVAEKRADGYHDMTMVMQTVSLCDTVDIAFSDSGRVQAKSNLSFVPGDARNLAVKAALAYLHAAELAEAMNEKHLRLVQEVAGLLGEDAAEMQIALRELKKAILPVEGKKNV